LAILQNFYDMTNVTALNGEAWPRQSEFGNIAELKLPLFAEKTDRLLAADTERSYSLHKLVNNLQNESVVLHGPAEGILYDYVRGQTARLSFSGWEWSDWQAWICVSVAPLSAAFGLCIYRLHQRVTGLQSKLASLMLGSLLGLPKGQAVELGLKVLNAQAATAAPTADDTTSANMAFLANLAAEIRRMDIAFVIIVIAVAMLFLWLIITVVRRVLAPRSYMYLEVRSAEHVLIFAFWTFPDASRYYSVKIPANGLRLQLQNLGLIGILSVAAKNWFVVNTLTGQRVELPKFGWLGPQNTRRLMEILAREDFTVTPIVAHNYEFDFGNARGDESGPPLEAGRQEPSLEFV